jgi:glycosyltransferase involved in cell wall biosynthesis
MIKKQPFNYLVTILIPVYNAEKYLNDTLNSACQQSYLNFEAIIIDDFSTDNSWDIACEFCKKDSRFKAYRNIRKGAAAARNYGFSLSKGDFIQYLDADDILHPKKLKTQIDYIFKNNLNSSILVGCQWQAFSLNIKNPQGAVYPNETHGCSHIHSNKDWLILRADMVPIAWLFYRTQIELVGGWNEELTRNDDGDLLYRVLSKIKEVHIMPQLLVYYRREDVISLSKGLDRKSLNSWVSSAITYKKVLTEVAPLSGREASDKFLFFLYYICLFRDSELATKCYTELYNQKNIYEVGDGFVFKLANLTNIHFAKIIRRALNRIRGLEYV